MGQNFMLKHRKKEQIGIVNFWTCAFGKERKKKCCASEIIIVKRKRWENK